MLFLLYLMTINARFVGRSSEHKRKDQASKLSAHTAIRVESNSLVRKIETLICFSQESDQKYRLIESCKFRSQEPSSLMSCGAILLCLLQMVCIKSSVTRLKTICGHKKC